jgi:hypothetical protein
MKQRVYIDTSIVKGEIILLFLTYCAFNYYNLLNTKMGFAQKWVEENYPHFQEDNLPDFSKSNLRFQ